MLVAPPPKKSLHFKADECENSLLASNSAHTSFYKHSTVGTRRKTDFLPEGEFKFYASYFLILLTLFNSSTKSLLYNLETNALPNYFYFAWNETATKILFT